MAFLFLYLLKNCMDSFISKVVGHILTQEGTFSNKTVVLPSQRACVFLKQELINQVKAPFQLPKIVSIEQYIQELADVSLIDNTQLLFEFYSIYLKEIPKKNLDSFEIFSQWATIALHDFNDLDSYLVDTTDFFSNLRDIKRLEEWFKNENPSQLALNYFQFFEYLNILYTALYDKLVQNKVGYQGLVYREATKNLEYFIENNSKEHTIFIGFNALNKAEEEIFQALLHSGLASVYWDVSADILDKNNEAGHFLRSYKDNWTFYNENPFSYFELENNENQHIEIIGAPKNVSQIKYAGELLSTFNTYNETALILADENLLSLTLSSLPSSVQHINITMGYPLKDIPIANLFQKLFKAYLNQQKFGKELDSEFYFKDVLGVLNDPVLSQLNQQVLQKVVERIKFENRIFLSLENIKEMVPLEAVDSLAIVLNLFRFSTNVNQIIKQCSDLIFELKEFSEGIEKEYLYRFFTVFQQLEALNTQYNYIDNLKTLNLFFQQLIGNEKLSFQGEPLKGLQLMGMLETRALDFETLIITSVNEGKLPGGKNEISFVPYDVKKYFGLPTYQEKDAIFSYHFQRLLYRAKNVFLLYNSESDGYGSGEKSRFLTKMELTNPAIIKKIISPKVQKTTKVLNEVEKTPEVLQRLKELFSYGISPSAVASYIYNPIKFYEQKVLKISEESEVEETIAVNTMGTVIHGVLEDLYDPFKGKFLKAEDIKAMNAKIEGLLLKNFNEHYVKGNILTGKNKLIFEVCRKQIERFLKQELDLLKSNKQLKIINLEAKIAVEIAVPGIDFPINMRGIVDRIDQLDGVVRIIDYKTGMVKDSDLKVTDFSLLSTEYKYTKALQVLMYAYMFHQNNPENSAIEAGIFSFKNLNGGLIQLNFSEKRGVAENSIQQEHLELLMDELHCIFTEIMNPEIPFKQNENLPY